MNRTSFGSRALAVLAAIGMVGAPVTANVKADEPRVAVSGYLAMKEAIRRKLKRAARRRPGETPLRGPVWKWAYDKGILMSMGTRPHCSKHRKRFKHLRSRFVLEDETSGIRRSIKARTFGCPTCLRARA